MFRRALFYSEVLASGLLTVAFLGVWASFAGPQMHVAETFSGILIAVVLFLFFFWSARRRLRRREDKALELQQAAEQERIRIEEEQMRREVEAELLKKREEEERVKQRVYFEDPIRKSSTSATSGRFFDVRAFLNDLLDGLTPEQQLMLQDWLNDLLEIRKLTGRRAQVKRLGQNLKKSRAIAPLAKILLVKLKKHGWDDLGPVAKWAMAFGGGGLLFFGGAGAGIAAFGGAIGVPLFVVFGAGGALAGTIVQEIERKRGGK